MALAFRRFGLPHTCLQISRVALCLPRKVTKHGWKFGLDRRTRVRYRRGMTPLPTRFFTVDTANPDWEEMRRRLTFDQHATLKREAAVRLLSEYVTLLDKLRLLAWDPKSTRRELQELVTDRAEGKTVADIQAMKQRRQDHGIERHPSAG
jgi:hypothetical protein